MQLYNKSTEPYFSKLVHSTTALSAEELERVPCSRRIIEAEPK